MGVSFPYPGQQKQSGYAADVFGAQCDPAVAALGRALACALRDIRPVVELPPHLSPPFRSVKFGESGRLILPDTAASSTVSASAVSGAEGVDVADASAEQVVVEYEVQNGYVAIVRLVGYECADLGGYDADEVTFHFRVGEKRVQLPQQQQGLFATVARPTEMWMAARPKEVIQLLASNSSAVDFHLVEGFFEGYLIDVNSVTEELRSLIDACK